MNKLDALAVIVRDMLRDYPSVTRIEVKADSKSVEGLFVEVHVHNNDGTEVRLVRTGECPF